MKKRKYKKPVKSKVASEPEVDYGQTISITTPGELEERNRKHTGALTYAERMAYLQRLNENVFGTDLSEQIKILKGGRIFFKSIE